MAKKFKLTHKQKNWLLSAHLLFMVAWLGGTLCMFTLSVAASTAGDGDALYVTYLNINMLDDVFIKYPAVGTLITGILLCVFSNWGLTNYYWIIVKEISTLSIIGFGIFAMDPWLDEATALISAAGLGALTLPVYVLDRNMLYAGALLNISAMAAMVVISSLKPWGKRKPRIERVPPSPGSSSAIPEP